MPEPGSQESLQTRGLQLVSETAVLDPDKQDFFECEPIATPIGFVYLYGGRENEIEEGEPAYSISSTGLKEGTEGEFYNEGQYELWVCSHGLLKTGHILGGSAAVNQVSASTIFS